MNKKMRKIRKLLGEDYHICETLDIENGNSWVLYSTCNNNSISYFSKYNKPIMTSEKNTLDELYAFAKRHHKLNGYLVSFVLLIYAWFVFILSILNVFICSKLVNGFVLGSCVGVLLYSIVEGIISEHNLKVKKLEYKELLESWGKDDE